MCFVVCLCWNCTTINFPFVRFSLFILFFMLSANLRSIMIWDGNNCFLHVLVAHSFFLYLIVSMFMLCARANETVNWNLFICCVCEPTQLSYYLLFEIVYHLIVNWNGCVFVRERLRLLHTRAYTLSTTWSTVCVFCCMSARRKPRSIGDCCCGRSHDFMYI